MKTLTIALILMSLVITTAGCAPAAVQIVPTAAPTETPVPTVTVTSAVGPTPTPEPTRDPYVIDRDRLHNFPQSYEYVLAHPDEFVRAPDPFTERAAFDMWWNEQLIPALGSVFERRIELMGGYGCDGLRCNAGGGAVSGEPTGFFYFIDGGILRPVVMLNIGDVMNSGFIVTMAVILFDLGDGCFNEDRIQSISEGHKIQNMTIFTTPEDPIQTLYDSSAFEFAERVIGAGFKGDFDDNRVAFGAGTIWTEGCNE